MRFGFIVIALLTFTGCDYTERFASGRLSGDVSPTPSDWSLFDGTMLVQLETNPIKPYSVNIWGVGIGSNYYVAAGEASEADWANYIERNKAVRLRIEERIYLLDGHRVEDIKELQRVILLRKGKSTSRYVNIQTKRSLYMEGKGLHEEKLTLFGRPLFPIPKFLQRIFFKHDIHHMITGYGTDLSGEARILCWEVGAGIPWYYTDHYGKFLFICIFRPSLAMAAFKLGQTQHSLYDVDDQILRTKTVEEVEHYIEHGIFPED